MTDRTRAALLSLPADNALPPDIQAKLAAPLYARIGSLMVGHITVLFMCAIEIAWLGGLWPRIFLAVNLVTLIARLHLLRRHRRAAGSTANLPRGRRRYQLVGLTWAFASGLTYAYAIVEAEDGGMAGLLGTVIALGTCSGIASRNAGTPRFALAQLAFLLLPNMAAYLRAGSAYAMITGLEAAFLAALCSIVRQHYLDIRSLIDAERQGRIAQTALAAREAELRAIFDHAAASIVEIDLVAMRWLRVNPEFCRVTGRTEAELLGTADVPLVTHPEDHAADARRWSAPAEVGHVYTYEKRFVRPDGRFSWIRVTAWITATGPDGIPTRAVAIGQDCTRQRAAEEALRASEEMLRLSLEVGRIGSFRRDFGTGLLHCAQETRLMHGLPVDDAPLPVEAWLDLLVPEDRVRIVAEMAAAQTGKLAVNSLQYSFIHPVHGVRHIETRSRITFDDSGEPVGAVGVAIDVTERRMAEARIAHLAHHDPLTGLPNRSLFGLRLDEALARARRGDHFALCCLDLDRFKDVNDTLGHPVGDALLQAVTARLKLTVRPTDTVARLGGDEFAIIQASLDRPADAAALAERLIEALATPFALDGFQVTIGTSIGIAISPDAGMDAATLLRHADMALYAAKTDGRGRWRLFERHMDADLQARRTLELDLRRALEHREFELFYQPVIEIASRRVCGFEALLRWHHPERGLVAPDRFIPLAEATGLLVPIGAWVLFEACAQAAGWRDGARVAVNVSAVQFAGRTLVADVAAALDRSGLDPRRLELEITETAMLQDTEATLATLHELKALGVTIAMDDFGTGYSSLSYLQRFPFDKVKIDRSFTTHLGNRRESAAIVSAVIDLCGSLDMLTNAEGVETEAQFEALAKIGCAEAQGYLFSPPRPAGEIAAMVARAEARHAMVPAAD